VRRYVVGRETNSKIRAQQFQFVPGSSDPPGPGTNSAGLGIFRYETRGGRDSLKLMRLSLTRRVTR